MYNTYLEQQHVGTHFTCIHSAIHKFSDIHSMIYWQQVKTYNVNHSTVMHRITTFYEENCETFLKGSTRHPFLSLFTSTNLSLLLLHLGLRTHKYGSEIKYFLSYQSWRHGCKNGTTDMNLVHEP